jgi:hypothetical protein
MPISPALSPGATAHNGAYVASRAAIGKKLAFHLSVTVATRTSPQGESFAPRRCARDSAVDLSLRRTTFMHGAQGRTRTGTTG